MDWPQDIKNQHAEIQKNAQIKERKLIEKKLNYKFIFLNIIFICIKL